MDKHTEDLIKVLNAHADYFERESRPTNPLTVIFVLGLIGY